MRLFTLLSPALLAVTALAAESEADTTASSSIASSSSSSSSAAQPESTDEPTPIGAIWSPKWKAADIASYTKKCASKATINAQIYKLGEIYPALKDWAPELKVFYHKQYYAGSWGGEDKHGNDRELLKMDYEELPFAVREWLKNNPKQRQISVQDSVVFFAPGAIYPILPLFVDEPEAEAGSIKGECDGIFDDLESYSAEAKDGAVLGNVTHKKGKGKQDVEITIEAFQVKTAGQARDEL